MKKNALGLNSLADTERRRKRAKACRNRPSSEAEPPEEGGPDEAAALIAETVEGLARLAQRHRLDVLGHLLAMAQLEAEDHLRLRSRGKLS